MKELLKKFENKLPEIVFEWSDEETGARGWAVINSLRNGAAGGGTRMRKGLDKEEVISLAKTMEIKFTVSGPPIGGAKSGIDFDPSDDRKEEVLKRWYKAVSPLLKNYYGTGGDLNVDEIHEVIPITEDNGLWHPQEGIVNGHFRGTVPERIRRIGNLRLGVTKIIEDPEFTPNGQRKYTIADMITGYGVSESVRHYLKQTGDDIRGKRVIIQGWGNVGAAAALYMAKEGALIVGIIDKNGGLIREEGMGLERVKQLFDQKVKNTLADDGMIPFDEVNAKVWDIPNDIFIPAAASRLVDQKQLERLIASGTQIISSGANVPFKDPEIFYGPTMEYADKHLTLIPDFIANCGMARVFAYLMETTSKITDYNIFNDVSTTIEAAIASTLKEMDGELSFSESAFKRSLDMLLK